MILILIYSIIIQLVLGGFSSSLKSLASQLLEKAPDIAVSTSSYMNEMKYKAKLLEFIEDKDKAKKIVEHFTTELNDLTSVIEDVDSEIYQPLEILEYNRIKKRKTVVDLILQAVTIYRVLFDSLYPELVNEKAVIVAIDENDILFEKAINKYEKYKKDFLLGRDNECTKIVKIFEYFISLGKIDSDENNFEKIIMWFNNLSKKERLKIDVHQINYYEKKIIKLKEMISKIKSN